MIGGSAALDVGVGGTLQVNGSPYGGSVCVKLQGAALTGLGFEFPAVTVSPTDALTLMGAIAAKTPRSAAFSSWVADASKVPLPALTGAQVSLHTPGLGCAKFASTPGVGGTLKGSGTFHGYTLGSVDLAFALDGNADDGLSLVTKSAPASLTLGSDVVSVSGLDFKLAAKLSQPLDGKLSFSGAAKIGNWQGVRIDGSLSKAAADFGFFLKLGDGKIRVSSSVALAARSGKLTATVAPGGATLESQLKAMLSPKLTAKASARRDRRRKAHDQFAAAASTYRAATAKFMAAAAEKVCGFLPGSVLTDAQKQVCESKIGEASTQVLSKIAGYSDWALAAAAYAESLERHYVDYELYNAWNNFLGELNKNTLVVQSVSLKGSFSRNSGELSAGATLVLLGTTVRPTFTLSPSATDVSDADVETAANAFESPPATPPAPNRKGVATVATIREVSVANGTLGSRRVLEVTVKPAGKAAQCFEEQRWVDQEVQGTVYFYKSRVDSLAELTELAAGGGLDLPVPIGSATVENGLAKLNGWNPQDDNYPYSLKGMESLEEGVRGTWYIHAIFFGGPTSCSGSTPEQNKPENDAAWGYRFSASSFAWVHGRADDVGELTPAPLSSWGTWQKTADCPAGSWAVSFRQRNEKSQGDGDDTAMNSLELYCRAKSSTVLQGPVSSHAGFWGDWATSAACAQGSWLTAAKLSAEPSSAKDDTGSNDSRFRCSGSTAELATGNGNTWGTWGAWASCPTGSAICGIALSVEPKQGSGDDTAMNGMRLRCCALPQ